ncbi:MAG: type II toxin-antitoxin system HicA family toxin [Lentihominibacter sp.]|nr:type II toxin-antitoxin system HicA family toxin [Lentihominibacter sp.]
MEGSAFTVKKQAITRLKSEPKDYTFDELEKLLKSLGFNISNKGRSSGSRVAFVHDEVVISLHRSHPGNVLKRYQIKQVIDVLSREELV